MREGALGVSRRISMTQKEYLDRLYNRFSVSFLPTDPLSLVHRFKRPEDQEIVGFVVSCLAYGRVGQILSNSERLLRIMGSRPYDFVARFEPARDAIRFEGFVHRFTRGRDVACLLYFLRQVLERTGSIEAFFSTGYGRADPDVRPALTHFVERMLKLEVSPFCGDVPLPVDAGVRYLLPSPATGSACKRLNLFLRWMVRRGDGIDLGLWDRISPAQLIVPLDTHVARISQRLGLTRFRSVSWRMAEDVTHHLRSMDPDDPVKYDFALSRLGILGQYPRWTTEGRCDGDLGNV